ncbi:MAG: hypothetical protein AAFO74_16435 [Pseudomonadota bacterium]
MTFRKLLLAGAATSVAVATFAAPTQASIIDRPHFKVEPIIIVWAADANGSAGMVTEFIVGSDPNTDLISEDGRAVNTGTLTPTDDALGTVNTLVDVSNAETGLNPTTAAAGSVSSFAATETLSGSSSTTAWASSFYVATNTAFSINAEATETLNSGDFVLGDIGFTMSKDATSGTVGTIDWGAESQDPSGAFPEVADLGELTSETLVFDGTNGNRTASGTGSIAEQSIRFDVAYSLAPDGYDLSMGSGEIQADVTYTFFAA